MEGKVKKREEMEREVELLRRELERLNNMRNNMYAVIGNEERAMKDKEAEKDRMIV